MKFYQKPKWQKKYLKLAQTLAEDGEACFSRKIGCVIVSDDNTIVTMGYNGAYRGSDSPDSYDYLRKLWGRLDDELKEVMYQVVKSRCVQLGDTHKEYDPDPLSTRSVKLSRVKVDSYSKKTSGWMTPKGFSYGTFDEPTMNHSNDYGKQEFCCKSLDGCKTCPRRLLNIPSGERRELCPCACAERNALNNANRCGGKTLGAVCFCTHHPCYECSIALIQAGIKAVVYIEDQNRPYIDATSKDFLKQAEVETINVAVGNGV